MEDTLGGAEYWAKRENDSLNPCFNGRYSRSSACSFLFIKSRTCLNPCFNGRYSRSITEKSLYLKGLKVLILVLMEDTLGVIQFLIKMLLASSLNPCFNGRYSRRIINFQKVFIMES